MHSKDQLPNRRATDLGEVSGRRASLEARMDALERKLDRNTELTQDVVNVFSTLESGIKVMGWIGQVAKWVVAVGGAIGVVIALVHGNAPPDK